MKMFFMFLKTFQEGTDKSQAKTTSGKTLQRCQVFPDGAPPLLLTSSGSLWLMDSHQFCYLGFLTRSTSQIDASPHILWRLLKSNLEQYLCDQFSHFQVEKKEDGIAGEREENPVMEAVRRKIPR